MQLKKEKDANGKDMGTINPTKQKGYSDRKITATKLQRIHRKKRKHKPFMIYMEETPKCNILKK